MGNIQLTDHRNINNKHVYAAQFEALPTFSITTSIFYLVPSNVMKLNETGEGIFSAH